MGKTLRVKTAILVQASVPFLNLVSGLAVSVMGELTAWLKKFVFQSKQYDGGNQALECFSVFP
jgi:hypothetical protein